MKLWIANNGDGAFLTVLKPKLDLQLNAWVPVGGCFYIMLPEGSFPEVTFENSPQEVELKLVK